MQRPYFSSTRRALHLAASACMLACGASRIEDTPRVAHGSVDDAGGPIDAITPRVEGAIAADASVGEKDVPAPRARCGNLGWVPQVCYVRDLGDPQATADTDEEAWLVAHGAKSGDVKTQMNAHRL